MLDPKLLPDWKDDGLADAIHQFPCNQQSAIPSVDYDGEYAELQKWGFGGRISISMMVIPSRRHQIYRLLDPALRSSDLFSRKYYSPLPYPCAGVHLLLETICPPWQETRSNQHSAFWMPIMIMNGIG